MVVAQTVERTLFLFWRCFFVPSSMLVSLVVISVFKFSSTDQCKLALWPPIMTITYGCPYGSNLWLLTLNHFTLFCRAYLTCLMSVWRFLEMWVSISNCFYIWFWRLQHLPVITSFIREHWFLWCQQHIRQCCCPACETPVNWLLTWNKSLFSLYVWLLLNFGSI